MSSADIIVHHLLSSLATSSYWPALTIPLTCVDWTIDFDRGLTFCQSWLLQSKCSLHSFSRRFHFCSIFLHILLLNKRIRTSLLPFTTIVADNLINVFAIFVNVLTTILRLAIIATNQLFQFLLLLFLTLRVSNQWLSSLHSLNFLDPLSPFLEITL